VKIGIFCRKKILKNHFPKKFRGKFRGKCFPQKSNKIKNQLQGDLERTRERSAAVERSFADPARHHERGQGDWRHHHADPAEAVRSSYPRGFWKKHILFC
jgi:hypothetical protein